MWPRDYKQGSKPSCKWLLGPTSIQVSVSPGLWAKVVRSWASKNLRPLFSERGLQGCAGFQVGLRRGIRANVHTLRVEGDEASRSRDRGSDPLYLPVDTVGSGFKGWFRGRFQGWLK